VAVSGFCAKGTVHHFARNALGRLYSAGIFKEVGIEKIKMQLSGLAS